jgi:hypothetical protein
MLGIANKENLPLYSTPGSQKAERAQSLANAEDGRQPLDSDDSLAPHKDENKGCAVSRPGDATSSMEKRLAWAALSALPQNVFVLFSVLATFPGDEGLVRASLTHLLIQSAQVATQHANASDQNPLETAAPGEPLVPVAGVLGHFGAELSIYVLIESLWVRWSSTDRQILRLLCGLAFDVSTAPEGRATLAKRTRLLEQLCATIAEDLPYLEGSAADLSANHSDSFDQLHALYYALGALGNVAAAGQSVVEILSTHLFLFSSCVRLGVAHVSDLFREDRSEHAIAIHPMYLNLVMKLLRECLRLLLNMICHAEAAIVSRLFDQGLVISLEQIFTWPTDKSVLANQPMNPNPMMDDNADAFTLQEARLVLEQGITRIMPMASRLHRHLIHFQSEKIIRKAVDVALNQDNVQENASNAAETNPTQSLPQPWGVPFLFAAAFLGTAWQVGIRMAHHHRDFH